MTLNTVPLCITSSCWYRAFSGPFTNIKPLANMLERMGAVAHWAIVLANGESLYIEEGKPEEPYDSDLIEFFEWYSLPGGACFGVPNYVSMNIIQDMLDFITTTLASYSDSELSDELNDMKNAADNLPFLVSHIDREYRYQYVNAEYERVYKRPREEIIGLKIIELIEDGLFEKVRPYLDRALSGERVSAELTSYTTNKKSERVARHITCTFAPRYLANDIVGVYVCVRDETPLKRITQALTRFHEITSDTTLGLHQKIDKTLDLGREILRMPMAIVSHVLNNDYKVAYSSTEDGSSLNGQIFDLSNCYCVHTLNRDQVTGFYHAGKSDIATHPCYENFKLEAYIGVSLKVNGEVWGTLNFSGPEPRERDFNEDEYELVKLFGQWVGSELARAEDEYAIISAEHQHLAILEAVHDGIIGVDTRGNISFANSAAIKMVNASQENLVGQSVLRLLRPSSREAGDQSHYENLIRHAVNRGYKVASIDTEFYSLNGQKIPVKFACTPMLEVDGNTLGSVLTFHDITEQRLAQDALRQQMKLFKSLFMDAPEAVVVSDRNRQITMVNPQACKLFGYPEDSFIGATPDFLYADLTGFNSVGHAYADKNSPDHTEYQMLYRRSDGSEFMSENVRSKILDENGELSGFIVHARDISSRLNIEADIVKAQNRLSIATKSAGIGVWEMDVASQSLYWDARMFELYGIPNTGGELAFSTWEQLIHPDDISGVQEAAEKAIAQKCDMDVDFRVCLNNGNTRHIKANARVATNSDGEALYLFGVNFDFTERYETEAILKRAREDAIRASQAKSNFLATMSHEIRTPLNGVLGMAEILASSKLNHEQRNQLEIIRNSGESLLDLINEILDFSKIEAGHLSLDLVDFDIERLVYDLTRLLVVKAEHKGIELLVRVNHPSMPVLSGDSYRIRQILMNLIGNAIKFTEEGEVLVQVDLLDDPVESKLKHLVLSVTDTGIGISKQAQASLFQAFMQADNSTTRRFGGTGLGLAITKQLVDLMGGDISLESEEGIGTKFQISIPLIIAEQQKLHAQKASLQDLFNKRILVVDDNKTNLSIIENQLDQCGLTADFEQSSIDALNHLQHAVQKGERYDVVITDYLMPFMDGLSLSERLHQALDEEHWPRVMMISSSGGLSHDVLEAAGITICLNKPASLNEFKAGLIDLMDPDTVLSYSHHDIKGSGVSSADALTRFESAKILVVEDMKANLAVVKGMLADQGVTVEVAENGLEALEKWQTFKPSLILMDLHMPVMDGISAIKEIRKLEAEVGGHVPILVLTADIQPERVLEVEAVGGDGFISKPFRRLELLNTIASNLMNVDWKGPSRKEELELSEPIVMSQAALDESVLKGLEELLGDQVNDIVTAFLQDAYGIFEALEALLSSECRASDIYRPVHSLKSVSANIGANGLSKMAAKLEAEAKTDAVEEFPEKLEELKAEFQRVVSHLSRLGLAS